MTLIEYAVTFLYWRTRMPLWALCVAMHPNTLSGICIGFHLATERMVKSEERCCVCLQPQPLLYRYRPCGHACVCLACRANPACNRCPLCRSEDTGSSTLAVLQVAAKWVYSFMRGVAGADACYRACASLWL